MGERSWNRTVSWEGMAGLKAGDIFLAVMSVGYLGAAVAYLVGGNKGYALALACYALANCGLIWATK